MNVSDKLSFFSTLLNHTNNYEIFYNRDIELRQLRVTLMSSIFQLKKIV